MSAIRPIGLLTQSKRMINRVKPQKMIVPMTAVPLVAFYSGEREAREATEVLNFFNRKHIRVPDFLKPHYDTQTGFDSTSKDKLKKALTEEYYKGNISEQDYKKYLNKISFTGHDDADELAHAADSVSDTASDVEEGGIIETILDFLDDLF